MLATPTQHCVTPWFEIPEEQRGAGYLSEEVPAYWHFSRRTELPAVGADLTEQPLEPVGMVVMMDLPTLLILAVFGAVLVRIFWRLVVNMVIVGCLALVFAGLFELVSVMRPRG